jgi:Zn-dependent protease/predicted transcriptional regulator
MPGRSIRVARIAGIPVGVSPLWLIIVALITWSLGAGYYPGAVHGITPVASYALGLASALLLFASILAHEFGHALVARRRGVEIEEIDLWLLGGVARMSGRPQNPRDELSFALAGPAVTAVIAAVFGVLALALPSSVAAALRAVIAYQAEINLLILGFNLVPAFPLDGGRVARALLWRRSGDIGEATNTAAGLGRGFGYLLIAFGVLLTFNGAPGGLWFALIGVFLVVAASAERLQQQVVTTFTGIHAEELMSQPVISIPSELTLAQAQQYFARYRYTAFPVTDTAGRAVGVLSIDRFEKRSHSDRGAMVVEELADRDPALLIGGQEDVAHLLEQPAFARIGRAAVVDDQGQPVGIVSLTDVQRAIRAARLRNGTSGPARLVPR